MADTVTITRVQNLKEQCDPSKFFELPGEGIEGYTVNFLTPSGVGQHLIEIVNAEPGAGKFVHSHNFGDTLFVMLEGEADYLIDKEGTSIPMKVGDIAISMAGQWHGTRNTGSGNLRYFVVEGPRAPQGENMRYNEATLPAQLPGLRRVQNLKEECGEGKFAELPGEGIDGYTVNFLTPTKMGNHLFEIVNAEPGAGKFAHYHEHGDTVFVILEGEGEYILDREGNTMPIKAGDICISLAGWVHGTRNTGTGNLRYLVMEGPRAPEGTQSLIRV